MVVEAALWYGDLLGGRSLGDRAALAVGETRRCPAATADRVWASLYVGIEVAVIWQRRSNRLVVAIGRWLQALAQLYEVILHTCEMRARH